MPNILDEKFDSNKTYIDSRLKLITLLVFAEFTLNISGYYYYFYMSEYDFFVNNLNTTHIHAVGAGQVAYLFFITGGTFLFNAYFINRHLIDTGKIANFLDAKEIKSKFDAHDVYTSFLGFYFIFIFFWGYVYSYGMMNLLSGYSDVLTMQILMITFAIQITLIYIPYFVLLRLNTQQELRYR